MTIDTRGPWVDASGLHDGDDYDTAIDVANAEGGSTEALAAYLAQWDYGDETDSAHTTEDAPWGAFDTLHEVTTGGLDYILATNHQMGYVSLNRRPLTWAEKH